MLSSARYDTLVAVDARSAMEMARTELPDLVLLDGKMIDCLTALKSHPLTREIPVVVLASSGGAELRIAALTAGAEDVLPKPVSGARLLARMRSALRARDTSQALAERQATVRELGFSDNAQAAFEGPSRIALVTADPARGVVWASRLRPHLRADLVPLAPDAGLAEADRDTAADIFVIEAQQGYPVSALRLLSELRSRTGTRHAGIVVVHDPADADTAAMALDLGANDLCETGFDAAELALRLKIQLRRKREGERLRSSVDEGLRLAMVDPLTGLFNRRYAMAHAARLLSDDAARRGFCVIVADIDRFKSVNDSWGHLVGDAVLIEVAERLRDNMRGMDMVARIGGEEFMILLPETEREAALTAARRLCALIRDTPVQLSGARAALSVTVSLGVAMAEPGESVEAVLDRADKALYRAKETGRDRVTVSEVRAA